MQGMSWASIKKNPALIPLYVCAITGTVGATSYLIRLATKNPDVTWNSKKNSVPQNYYKDKQYKFWSSVDHDKIEKVQVPEY